MSYSVEISKEADSDLQEIFEYIAVKLQSRQNAAGQVSRLKKMIQSLDGMPGRFRRYGHEPWFSLGLHIVPVDHYCVFYLLNPDKKIVNIIRVLYGGRDMDTELATHTAE